MERRIRKIGILLFLFLFSLSAFAFQKLTSTQMRENSIRINALELNELDIAPPKEITIVLDDRALNFDFDKSIVKEKYYPLLENLRDFIKQNDYELTIVGHTDSIASNAYNMKLGQRRADSVKAKLIEFGLEADRIVGTKSRGEEEPITTNKTSEGRAQNRRVEFKLVQRETGVEVEKPVAEEDEIEAVTEKVEEPKAEKAEVKEVTEEEKK